MKKVIFCQFHNNMINGNYEKSIADNYYTGIYDYKEKEGYYKTDAFFELPLWIAEIKGSLTSDIKTDLLIIEDIQQAIKDIDRLKPDYICFSVLEVNKAFVADIIGNYKGKAVFCLGGYIDFKGFQQSNNIEIFDTVKDFINYLNIDYSYNLNYSHFKGFKTVPRLTLSKGCKNKCKFCIVDRDIKEINKRDILKQIKAFKPLKFKLIYLNDKTFGQANNYKLLPLLYKRIKKYNPDFKGFIIQTTCNQFLKPDFIKVLKNSYIFNVELGIETYNNKILHSLSKPQNIKIINRAMQTLKALNINVTVNIIIGLLGESIKTYNNTLNFIKSNFDNIYLLNIYNLAVYLNSELSKSIDIKGANDLNENSINKSFYSKKQLKANNYFYDNIFNLGMKLLKA